MASLPPLTGGLLSGWLLLDCTQMPCRPLQVYCILYRWRKNWTFSVITTLEPSDTTFISRILYIYTIYIYTVCTSFNSATHHLLHFLRHPLVFLSFTFVCWLRVECAPCIRWPRLGFSRSDAEECEVEHSSGSWNWCNLLLVYAVAYDAQEHVLLVGFLEAVDLEDLG